MLVTYPHATYFRCSRRTSSSTSTTLNPSSTAPAPAVVLVPPAAAPLAPAPPPAPVAAGVGADTGGGVGGSAGMGAGAGAAVVLAVLECFATGEAAPHSASVESCRVGEGCTAAPLAATSATLLLPSVGAVGVGVAPTSLRSPSSPMFSHPDRRLAPSLSCATTPKLGCFSATEKSTSMVALLRRRSPCTSLLPCSSPPAAPAPAPPPAPPPATACALANALPSPPASPSTAAAPAVALAVGVDVGLAATGVATRGLVTTGSDRAGWALVKICKAANTHTHTVSNGWLALVVRHSTHAHTGVPALAFDQTRGSGQATLLAGQGQTHPPDPRRPHT